MAAKQKPMTHEDILAAAQRMLPHDTNLIASIRAIMENLNSGEQAQPQANGQSKKKEKGNQPQSPKGKEPPKGNPQQPSKKAQKAAKAQNAVQNPVNNSTDQKKASKKSKRALLVQQYELIRKLPLVQDRIRAYAHTSMKVLVLLRGCPGSGKTSNAQSLLQSCGIENLENHLFSSDDFFMKEKKIVTFDFLDEGRKWNETRVHQAMKKQVTPVLVDDCFLKKMHCKPFYEHAIKLGYIVELIEPQDPVSNKDPSTLIRRTHIPVTFDVLTQMTTCYETIVKETLINYFKLQYHPGQEPPQKGETGQTNECVNAPKNSTTPKTSKPPSPPTVKKTSVGETNSPTLNDVLLKLKNLKVENEQSFDHVLFSKQDSSSTAKHTDNDLTAVSLSKNTILELQNLFGGYLAPNMLAKENVISLPFGLARQLHCYVMESIEEDMIQKEQALAKGIEADLQAREDAKKGLKEKFDLAEIMEKNLDLFVKEVRKGRSNTDLSAVIPVSKLYEKFPNLHSDELGRILKNTDECLRKVTSLTSSLPDSCTIVFKDAMEECEVSEVDRREAIEQALAYKKAASSLFEEKQSNCEKAKAAFKEGKRAVANFYFEFAKWQQEQIEKINAHAAVALLKGNECSDTLDMHFLSVKEAMQIMDLFLDHNIRKLSVNGSMSAFLFIITGRGAHSSYGNAVLKNCAKKRLAVRNIQYWEMNPGMLKVCVKSSCLLSFNV